MCTLTSHLHGVQNSPRDARREAKIPKEIVRGDTVFTREFGTGVPPTGEAKFPVTPGAVYARRSLIGLCDVDY